MGKEPTLTLYAEINSPEEIKLYEKFRKYAFDKRITKRTAIILAVKELLKNYK